MVSDAHHLTHVPYVRLACVRKKVDILPIEGVVSDGKITANKLHVTALALAGVHVDPVFVPGVRVAELQP